MTSNQRLNVVFIMSDQHSRAVTGCYGHDIVKTPHIDRLAETGIRYDNAFCASPLCGPSRVSWITGTHPHTHGAVTHNNSRPPLRQNLQKIHRARHPLPRSRPARRRLRHPRAGFIHADQHIEGADPFAELGFTSYNCDARSYGEQVGDEVQQRYNKANIISEMWEHTYRNVEGEPFPYAENQMWDTLINR